MDSFKDRILELQDQLGQSAGVDPVRDRFLTGVIAGYKDLILVEMPETEND